MWPVQCHVHIAELKETAQVPPTNAKQQHIRIDKPREWLFTTLLCLNTCKFKVALNPVEHLGSYHYQSLPPLSHHFKNCPLSAPMP